VKRPEGFDPGPQKPTETGQRKPEAKARRDAAPPAGTPKAGVSSTLRPVATEAGQSRKRSDAKPPREKRPRQIGPTRDEKRAVRAEARRFTRGSRRRRFAITTVVGLIVALVAVLAVAVFSPILALRTISVQGTSVIPASQVQDALSGQLGTPLALLNDDKIRSELSGIILIRSYVTEIVPPNTLVVRIVERKAIGALKTGSGYEQVDPAGVVLAKSSTPGGLPVIDIGKSGVNSAGFAAATRVLLAMPPSVLAEVGSISATTLDNVNFTLSRSNHTVIWGSATDSGQKAVALAVLLKTCPSLPVLNVTAPLALACGPVQVVPTATPTPTTTPKP
jgi:cell division protein FtsQ